MKIIFVQNSNENFLKLVFPENNVLPYGTIFQEFIIFQGFESKSKKMLVGA
jgi:hypothetical protein